MFAAAWHPTGLEGGLFYVALAVFLGASVVGLRVVVGQRRGRSLRPMLAVGLVALTALIAHRAWVDGGFPALRRFEVLLLSAWLVGAGVTVLDRRLDLSVLNAVAAPTLLLLVFFAVLLRPDPGAQLPAMRVGTVTHIVLASLGLSAFTLAAAVGALYLWQIRVLKQDPTAAVARRMPALQVLDRVNFVAAALGFPFVALSVVAGWLFIGGNPDRTTNWWLDPTVLATMSGLLVYVVLFGARAFLGWYGRRIAWLTLLGFVVIVGGFVVGRFCTSGNVLHVS